MKYHLDTIPVWDAFHEKKECSFCIMADRSEKSYVDSFLGGSVMEPDTRVMVNDKGFCPHHNQLLYTAQNRLGLALMTHTHTLKTIEKLDNRAAKLTKDAKAAQGGSFVASLLKKVTRKETGLQASINEFTKWLDLHVEQCIICDRIHYSLDRYAYTMLHLFSHDNEFKETLKQSKGFCLPHLKTVLNMALKTLSEKKQAELLSVLIPLQTSNIARQEQELLWFTQKFDYRNQEKPWGNSKDSLPRLLQRLTGKMME